METVTEWLLWGHDCLLISKFFFFHNNLLYMPVNFPFNFLSIFGCVAQADGSNIPEIFGWKLKLVDISPAQRDVNELKWVAMMS